MKKICLVYRRPVKAFFSIEKVFSSIKQWLSNKYLIQEISVPYTRATPVTILKNIFFARKYKADLYHITGDIHYATLAYPGTKTVLTIHDCVFLYNSTGVKKKLLIYLFLKWPVKHCKLITTISESTKKDIVRYSGCSPDKIIVIPNPLSLHIKYVPAAFNETDPVILFIGITPNKNLERVIVALEDIKCTLHIVGVVNDDIKELLLKHKIRLKNSSFLSDDELAGAYYNADLVLFPSLFEGFGLPIIEAQKAGRPVITSNIDPMKQVAGGAACLVNPNDINSIREGIIKVIADEAYRKNLVERGFQNICRFSNEVIAEQYMAVYERVLRN